MMWRIRRGKRQGQRDSEGGAVAVEFALILPFLALILCGIFDIGNLYYNYDLVNNAARQGARLFAVDISTSTPPYTLAQITTNLQNSYGNQLNVTANPNPPTSGGNVKVTVTDNVTIITPIIRQFFTNPCTVEATCTMYVE
ncbi:MAG: TadE/TadG family type IV pilus assembly protein [Desulfobaccales bacterium]